MSSSARLRRTGLAAAGAAVLAAAGLTAGAASAAQPRSEPEPDPGACPDGHVCMWKDPGYGGRLLDWPPAAEGDLLEIDDADDDKISSIANRAEFHIILYADDNAGGPSICLEPQQKAEDLGELGFDDEAESAVAQTSC